MEFWDIYDIDRVKSDKTVLRGETLGDEECHFGVHICVFNSNGEMLIQKRQPFKDGYPGRWDVSVGGSALSGETSREAARRELLEELGINYDFSGIRPHFTINRNHIFDDFYIIEKDVDLSSISLQEEEVAKVAWADSEKIIQMIEKKEFLPYYPELIQMIFVMRGRFGSYRDEK